MSYARTMWFPRGHVRVLWFVLNSAARIHQVLERMFWPVAPGGSKKDMSDRTRKWLKNLLRSVVVVFTVLVALVRFVQLLLLSSH